MTLAESVQVVGDLRRARQRQRVAEIHWVDALYQVYVTGVVAIVLIVFAASLVGDTVAAPTTLARAAHVGPAALALVMGAAVAFGLRSGSRGGPLALEQPDVRHVLLSPVDRGVALRGPAWRQIRFLVFASAAVGAVAGQLASPRLDGTGAAFMALGALLAASVAAVGFGSALVSSSLRIRPVLASVLALALVGGGAAELARRLQADLTLANGPAGSELGRLGLNPVVLGACVLAAVGLVAVGMRLIAGTSLEAAERRTALVGQLRFAVTLQDLRTVLVLRRQLAQERPRSRPWVASSRRTGRSVRWPVFDRGVRSVARWPLSRVVRLVVLATAAGLALRGAWAGTTPLIVLAGIALWIAALDAVEPLGQEIDHPGRTDAFPLDRGSVYLAHLPIVVMVMAVTGLVTAGVMAVPLGDPVPVGVAVLVGLTAGLLAGCGAVVSTVQGAPDAVDMLGMATPEIAGARTIMRTAWPPVLAVLGTLPVLAARAAEFGAGDPPPFDAAALAAVPLAGLVGLVGGWVRFHDEIHAWFRKLAEDMSPTKAVERAAAERRAQEEAEGSGAEEDEPGDHDEAQSRSPRPSARSGPVAPTPPGIQGGRSAKPIGRKRDQKPKEPQ